MPASRTTVRNTMPLNQTTINYIFDKSFQLADAESRYNSVELLRQGNVYSNSYMPDEVTRDCAGRMHYAAYRHEQARSKKEAAQWKKTYLELRDLIVLGNQKLVYRAVRKQMSFAHRSEDMIGEGHLVLIRAVAAYNPWLGIRFSTYAFTCLMRAFYRLTQQYSADWLSRSLDMESLSEGELREPTQELEPNPIQDLLGEFLSDNNPLLSNREKYIIFCRYNLSEQSASRTLEEVGQDLGLSKERVRQVQHGALQKLREALGARAKPNNSTRS